MSTLSYPANGSACTALPEVLATLPETDLRHYAADLYCQVQALTQDKAELAARRRQDEQLAQLADTLRWQADDTIAHWGDRLLGALVPMLDGLSGAAYYRPDMAAPRLVLVGGYATPRGTLPELCIGQGLSGAAAQQGEALYLDGHEHFRIHVAGALLDVLPHHLAVLPLVHNGHVEGLLELTFVHAPRPAQRSLLGQVCAQAAAHLNGIRAQLRIQTLLASAQAHNDTLAAQEEELRQNLEELEATQEEMRRTQAALRTNEARFRRIAANISGMLYQYQYEPATGLRGFVYVSERSTDVLGIAPHDLTALYGTGSELPVHPDDAAGFEAAFAESVTRMEPFVWVGRLQLPGGYRYVQAEGSPACTPDGCILWDGLMTDVTTMKEVEADMQALNRELAEREELLHRNLRELTAVQQAMQRSQQELQARDARFQRIASSINGVLYQYWYDPAADAGRFLYISPKSLPLLGYEAETRIGTDGKLMDRHPDDDLRFAECFAQAAACVQRLDWTGRIFVGGAMRWAHVDALPTVQDDGTILYEGLVTDVTQLKQAELHVQLR